VTTAEPGEFRVKATHGDDRSNDTLSLWWRVLFLCPLVGWTMVIAGAASGDYQLFSGGATLFMAPVLVAGAIFAVRLYAERSLLPALVYFLAWERFWGLLTVEAWVAGGGSNS